MDAENRSRIYTYREVRTASGQLVTVRCAPGDADRIEEFFRTGAIDSVELPATKGTLVGHGSYGAYSRYVVTQHRYSGASGDSGGWGFIEVLTIDDPPHDKHGIVMFEDGTHLSGGAVFTEWETLDHALAAFDATVRHRMADGQISKQPGFKRRVDCGKLTPWFYAVGEEELHGDYVLPCGLEDDPVFRLGRQFVVDDEHGEAVKTCMGCRFVEERVTPRWYQSDTSRTMRWRLVYWDDGTCWSESLGSSSGRCAPRPLEPGERWVTEALRLVRRILSGYATRFEVNFTNRTKFVGRIIQTRSKQPCAAGDYLVVVYYGDDKRKEGWVYGFVPSAEDPDIITHVARRFEDDGHTVHLVQVVRAEVEQGGKKWAGAFYAPPKPVVVAASDD